jgi:hypothetical protein
MERMSVMRGFYSMIGGNKALRHDLAAIDSLPAKVLTFPLEDISVNSVQI